MVIFLADRFFWLKHLHEDQGRLLAQTFRGGSLTGRGQGAPGAASCLAAASGETDRGQLLENFETEKWGNSEAGKQ